MAKILVADDDPDMRDLVGTVLDLRGHQVVLVEDGLTALEEIMSGRYDLVVLDHNMPGMTGLEVLQATSTRMTELARPIFLGLTALASRADVKEGYAAGADDLMAKPFSIHELAARVDALLDEWQLLRPPVSRDVWGRQLERGA